MARSTSFTTQQKEFDSSPLFGIGIGYQYNSWLRFDVTANIAASHLRASTSSTTANLPTSTPLQVEWLFLANISPISGTWYCLTPLRRRRRRHVEKHISGSRRSTPCVAYGDSATSGASPGRFHAGRRLQVTPAFTVELRLSYVSSATR